MTDKSQCPAAIFIKACRGDPELKEEVLAGGYGLFFMHILQNEHAWAEEELYGPGDGK